jgi:hypothetical protein
MCDAAALQARVKLPAAQEQMARLEAVITPPHHPEAPVVRPRQARATGAQQGPAHPLHGGPLPLPLQPPPTRQSSSRMRRHGGPQVRPSMCADLQEDDEYGQETPLATCYG